MHSIRSPEIDPFKYCYPVNKNTFYVCTQDVTIIKSFLEIEVNLVCGHKFNQGSCEHCGRHVNEVRDNDGKLIRCTEVSLDGGIHEPAVRASKSSPSLLHCSQ